MIGFYDYTVVLTYISILSSIIGMTFAFNAHPKLAVVCLALSGLCDMFDGKVARTKKNRTADECSFGIQLDSLADIVCFGILPAMLCYSLGVRDTIGLIAIIYYVLCGVIRLAYFNVLELNRQLGSDDSEKCYHGMPITTIAILLPLTYLGTHFLPGGCTHWILTALLVISGTAFIIDFKLKKPSNKLLAVCVVVVAAAVFALLSIQGHAHR
jgi:CDP-diacylglycerol--serine O-phosphatidyltransferase